MMQKKHNQVLLSTSPNTGRMTPASRNRLNKRGFSQGLNAQTRAVARAFSATDATLTAHAPLSCTSLDSTIQLLVIGITKIAITMADVEDNLVLQNDNDHQVCRFDSINSVIAKAKLSAQPAFIFSPEDDHEQATRPSKRRKVSKKDKSTADAGPTKATSSFVPLFNGAESADCVAVREQLFEKAWSGIEARIQVRFSNSGRKGRVAILIEHRMCCGKSTETHWTRLVPSCAMPQKRSTPAQPTPPNTFSI